jgi:hypothetical protein
MTKDFRRLVEGIVQGVLLDEPSFLREVVARVVQEQLKA